MSVCYLDLDGVLVDFVAGALALHNLSLPMADVRWDLHEQCGYAGDREAEFWDSMDHTFWANLPWTSEGRDLLAALEHVFGENIVLLTSPIRTPGGVEGKIEWIRRELPSYARRFMVGPPKHLMASPNKILIDDHEVNISKFIANSGQAVLVPRPWNLRRRETCPLGRFDVTRLMAEVH